MHAKGLIVAPRFKYLAFGSKAQPVQLREHTHTHTMQCQPCKAPTGPVAEEAGRLAQGPFLQGRPERLTEPENVPPPKNRHLAHSNYLLLLPAVKPFPLFSCIYCSQRITKAAVFLLGHSSPEPLNLKETVNFIHRRLPF